MYLQKLETHYLYPKILIVLSKEIMFESNQIRKLRQTIKPLNWDVISPAKKLNRPVEEKILILGQN